VHVAATVKNRAGQWGLRLHQEDFEIFDNGVPAGSGDLRTPGRDQRRLSVALLVAMSAGWSTNQDLKFETDPPWRFVRHRCFLSADSQDQVALYAFETRGDAGATRLHPQHRVARSQWLAPDARRRRNFSL